MQVEGEAVYVRLVYGLCYVYTVWSKAPGRARLLRRIGELAKLWEYTLVRDVGPTALVTLDFHRKRERLLISVYFVLVNELPSNVRTLL